MYPILFNIGPFTISGRTPSDKIACGLPWARHNSGTLRELCRTLSGSGQLLLNYVARF